MSKLKILDSFYCWLVLEFLPLNFGTKALVIWMESSSNGEYEIQIEENEDDPPTCSFQFDTDTYETALAVFQSVKETLKRLLNIPVEESWKEVNPLPVQKYKLVRFVNPLKSNDPYYNSYPFNESQHLLFLGEIEQMPGHCIVVDKEGKTFWGYHTSDFVELTDEEV